jgi:hypothetical protein
MSWLWGPLPRELSWPSPVLSLFDSQVWAKGFLLSPIVPFHSLHQSTYCPAGRGRLFHPGDWTYYCISLFIPIPWHTPSIKLLFNKHCQNKLWNICSSCTVAQVVYWASCTTLRNSPEKDRSFLAGFLDSSENHVNISYFEPSKSFVPTALT